MYRFALYITRVAGDYISLSGYCYYQDDLSKEFGIHEDIPAVSSVKILKINYT